MLESAFEQLEGIGTILERHFRDVMDLEFAVQEGELFILGCRPAKTTARARIRILIEMFLEGLITGKEVVNRLDPSHIEQLLKPTLELGDDSPVFTKGLPTCGGAACGVLALSVPQAVSLSAEGRDVVLLIEEVDSGMIGALARLTGLVTTRGGMTSHAAVLSRGLGLPCVVGASGISIDASRRRATSATGALSAGDAVSIDGHRGHLYGCALHIRHPDWAADSQMRLLLQLVMVMALAGEIDDDRVGAVWAIRDAMVNRLPVSPCPDTVGILTNWPPATRLASLRSRQSAAWLKGAGPVLDRAFWAPERLAHDANLIRNGLRMFLFRLISRHLGPSRHHLVYRPLFDPAAAVAVTDTSSPKRTSGDPPRLQLVSEEYAPLNRYFPELLEIASIVIHAAYECRAPEELWRLDHTNPLGAKLLQGAQQALAHTVEVNGRALSPEELLSFYRWVRLRECVKPWYEADGLSRALVLQWLSGNKAAMGASKQLATACYAAGLTNEAGDLTSVGEALSFAAEWPLSD